ncbi:hypothetical protein [Enterobacter sichuanensis]|uniref:Nucleoside 2-deoxyribosyltransferase n=1 Tax=Enterobacter sichuanensis TaxID=2071710 RepID=A0ABS6GAF8_9ENTR|nr:hypothetical protein [Enterobacter sichuanensis]MBU5923018.1 hypothetical protein [Enterobacter sichuanensis]OZV03311.1 hypothetical protein CIW55_01655 [Enterobacter cloacae]PAO17460.1 hypothetical protein CIW58_01935 [Enterobacter cloacae]
MDKPKFLVVAGEVLVGEDYIEYLGINGLDNKDSQTGVVIPAAPGDIRTNMVLSEGELNFDYYLNSDTSSFSINLWAQFDNLIFTFNEYPAFCVVKKIDKSGLLTPIYSVGHSNASKINSTSHLCIKDSGGFLTVEVDGVGIIKHPFPNNGMNVFFYTFGNDGLKFSNISLKKRNPKAFVVMQFKEEFNELYNEVIKPVCESAGLKVVRADESTKNGSIIEEIIAEIVDCTLIIADITPDNPNVYYEVGFAHGIKKNVILMCNEKREKLPFDLVDVRTIFYKNSIAGNSAVREKLKNQVETILRINNGTV